ncbi:MAG: hypothetical protein ACR2K6_11225 [Solirubrobacterales bacterium]
MKILMVCAADSTAPGEKQAIWLGEALVSLGHEVLISLIPDRVEGGDRLGGGALQVHRRTPSSADRCGPPTVSGSALSLPT